MSLRTSRRTTSFCVFLGLVLVVAGCSSQQISDELRADAFAAAQQLTVGAGLELTSEDLDCVIDDLGNDQATELIDATSPGDDEGGSAVVGDELLTAVADGVLACVGTGRLGLTALASRAPNASEPSLRCAALALDPELFRGLVLDQFVPQPSGGTELDLEVGVALAACLTPEELLELSG